MDHYADFSKGSVIKVHSNQLEKIKDIAKCNISKKRYRLCLQDSPQNPLHEMIICRCINDYSRPDKHKGISESHTIIEGSEAIILFDDLGNILDVFLLDREKGYISYRINDEIYHMTVPLTDTVIDYEVKLGPFNEESNIFPEWAPKDDEKDAVEKFMRMVKRAIEKKCGIRGSYEK